MVCIKGENNLRPEYSYPDNIPTLVEGAIYTVRDVRVCREGGLGLILREVGWTTLDGGDGSYAVERFRKVQRRKTDLSIESFLTIKPGFEEPRRQKAPAKREAA